VKCWSAPRSKAALAGVIAIETRDRDGPRDGPPTPGPRLPAPQPMNKLRHTKTIGARSGFTCFGICRRRASSSDRLLTLTNAFTAGWLGGMAISGQTQPQEFSLYRYRKGKSDPEHGKWSKKQDQGGQNKRTMQRRLVPPWPYRVGSGVNWFGNDRFWTQLPADVTWGRGEKTFWFRQEWGYYGPRPWDTGKGCWQVDGYGHAG
jgi:hypothetical protein